MESSIWVDTTTGVPFCLHSAMMAFCMGGTDSTLVSTPRSPRATITASASLMISESSPASTEVSIFAMMNALLPTSRLASMTSSLVLTQLRAIQSTPISRPNSISLTSWSVRARYGRWTLGIFTRSLVLRRPPRTISRTVSSIDVAITLAFTRPPPRGMTEPGVMYGKTLAYGKETRVLSPTSSFRSRTNLWPSSTATDPSLNSPIRSFGPWRSMRTPMVEPWRASILRIRLIPSLASS
mmetsp:Transcript_14269/g.28786  ORF Transcript_14269/g.28786 Transcript_14269/m.28786 type:complete len:239 (+) Transcript_14269:651-1367(+)